jgi:hypothetical protein
VKANSCTAPQDTSMPSSKVGKISSGNWTHPAGHSEQDTSASVSSVHSRGITYNGLKGPVVRMDCGVSTGTVVGITVLGSLVGEELGTAVVGWKVGNEDGKDVEGLELGILLGNALGDCVGADGAA